MESRRAFAISGSAHGALVAWALVSGWLSGAFEDPTLVSEVSLISGDEFAALVERAGEGAPAAAPEPTPEPDPVPEEPTRPTPEAAAPATPETVSGPVPEVAPETTPEPAPEPAAPAVPRDSAALELDPDPGEMPTPAPRVAPRPADRPAPEASVAPEREEAVVPRAAEAAPAPVEQTESAAPEAATTRIVTEATEEGGARQVALAPPAAARPRARPERTPAPALEPAALPAPEAAPAPQAEPERVAPLPETPEDPLAAAIAGAVADAVPEDTQTAPLTLGERDALRLAVQSCWVVDVGSPTADVVVTVAMSMAPDGRVVPGSLRQAGAQGGTAQAQEAAFQAARRAVLRCQGEGFDLPAEKYEQWQEIEMVFDPSEMRQR